jgi:phosphomannomutase
MAETGAVFGGEHSGHYYYRDNYRADSGIITAMVVLQLLSESSVPLSELVSPYDRFAASGEINTQVQSPANSVAVIAQKLKAQGVNVDMLDGMTADYGTWWFNLRPSNTEPLLRLNVEAPNEKECQQRVDEVLQMIKEV